MKHKFFTYIALLAIILYTYWGLWDTFFQQDEWASMGLAFSGGLFAGIKDVAFVELAAGKMRAAGTLLNTIFHLYFPFNILLFSVFALAIHWVNSILVYHFAFQVTKRPFIAFVSALYFSVAAISSGAVTWISAYTTALVNATFVLISLICYMKFLHTSRVRYRTASFIAATIAFLFKESSIFVFILLPFLSVLFGTKRTSLKKIVIDHAPLLIYLGFIILVRTVSLLGPEGRQGVFVTQQPNVLARLATHALFYPVLSFSQLYIPQEIMAKVTGKIAVSDTIAVVTSMIFITYALLFAYKHIAFRTTVFFCLLYSFLSFLPFIVLDRPLSSYLESRYYYLGIIGAAILLGTLLDYWNALFVKTRFRSVALVSICILSSVVLYKNSTYVRREIRRQIITANDRKLFLSGIKEIYSALPDNPIFYITGDSPGFYGIGDLSVPFQQGMGYTMMVWYFDTGKIPAELLSDMYLWNINEQGYRQIQGKGFGYFYQIGKLQQAFREDPTLAQEQVIGFSYKAGAKELIDITQDVRRAL